jgi:hypothetical protein
LLEIPPATRNNRIVPAGRPSSYTPEIADAICECLVNGESLRRICDRDGMPHPSTLCRWLEGNPAFREQYARARELQADILAAETLSIADTTEEGVIIKIDKDGNELTERRDMTEHRRLKIDARKWYASKLAPKKYGDLQQIQQRLVDEAGRDREPLNVVFVGVGQAAVAARGKPPALALQPPEETHE